MKQRIGAPPAGVTYPIWAWYQWGSKRKRLDMRSHGRGWCAEKGTLIVLLTIDVPEQQVLLHDFDYWHHVLNNWAIEVPFDENAVYTQEEKEKSWNYIFDIACSFEEEERKNFYTQATFWELRKEWVIKAEHYISR